MASCSYKHCGFLALPPELRNRIYADHFTLVDEWFYSPYKVPVRYKSWRDEPSVLALLQTCRQIRDEAEGIFFSANHLETSLSEIVGPRSVLSMLSTVRCQSVRRLTLVLHSYERAMVSEAGKTFAKMATELKRLCHIETLHFQLECHLDLVQAMCLVLTVREVVEAVKTLKEVKFSYPGREIGTTTDSSFRHEDKMMLAGEAGMQEVISSRADIE